MKAKHGKAAIYARLSSDRDGEAISVPLQIEACREEAERRGLTVPDSLVFQDRNKSASKPGTKRPGYDALIAAVTAGKADTLIVRETSRLYRRPMELEKLVAYAETGQLTIVPLFDTDMDLTSGEGLLVARIKAAVDAEEVRKLSQRVRMAKAKRREEGRHNGGGRKPYGYRRTADGFEIVPEEAALIREAVDRILGGETVSRIVTDWNDRGETSGEGYRWSPTHLRRILTGRNGKTQTDGGTTLRGTPLIVGGNGWPAIVSPDEVALVTAKLAEAKPGQLPGATKPVDAHPGARRYALSGLLVCGECGSKMLGSSGYYRCAPIGGGCGRVGVKARALEDVLDLYIQREREAGHARDPQTPTPVPAGGPEERAGIMAELADIEATVEQLADRLTEAKSATERKVTERAIEKLAVRDEAARVRLASLVPDAPSVSYEDLLADNDFHERWVAGELTPTELGDLRDMFGAYFEAIRIAPRVGRPKKLDVGRITVQHRTGTVS